MPAQMGLVLLVSMKVEIKHVLQLLWQPHALLLRQPGPLEFPPCIDVVLMSLYCLLF